MIIIHSFYAELAAPFILHCVISYINHVHCHHFTIPYHSIPQASYSSSMNSIVKANVLLPLITLLGLCCLQAISRNLNEASMSERHEMWMKGIGRVYTDDDEKEKRFNVFKDNVQFIESFNNAGDKPYKLSINEFADITAQEFKALRNGYKVSSKLSSTPRMASSSYRYEEETAIPSSIDWRQKGAVTPIKNQGQCGCCWAFSAVAAVEGITQITTGKLISLSEQDLVDCDSAGESHGCEGGLMDDAFKFIIQNNGIPTEANYPYKAADGTCNRVEASNAAAHISGYEDVPANNETSLLKAVANQPVSVAIDASGSSFQFYSSGVFTGECGSELDHGVAVVGYGSSEDGRKFWLVKNSWGSGWGESGYIRMERDVAAEEGLCGIAMQPSFPTS